MLNMYPPDLRDLSESYELGWQVQRDGVIVPALSYKKDIPREVYTGKLVIRVKRAESLHKTTSFGKMDPHCKLFYGDFKNQTKAVKDGHTNPEWKEMFEFPIDLKTPIAAELTVNVFNNKDSIGKVVFNVAELVHVYVKQREKKMPKAALPALSETSTDGKVVEPPEPPEEGLWFDLGRENHQKTPAGRILLAFKFLDANPKPREPRKTVDKGRNPAIATGPTTTPPQQPKPAASPKDEKTVSGPKPPSSPKPGDTKEEKKRRENRDRPRINSFNNTATQSWWEKNNHKEKIWISFIFRYEKRGR